MLSYPLKKNAYWPDSFELLLPTRVTVAEADEVPFACAVAVTVTVAGLGRLEGAVYTPALLIVPQLFPEHPDPLTFHVIALFVLPDTLAWNFCCVPTASITVVGEIVTSTGGRTVTVAEAETAESPFDVAVT